MRLFSWLITLIIALIAASFAVSNTETATLSIWPLPFEIALPLYLLVFAPFVLGFFIGGLVSWLAAGKSRGRAREAERSAYAAKRDRENLERDLGTAQTKIAEMEDTSKALTIPEEKVDTSSRAA